MPLFYVSSDPGVVSPRIVSIPLAHPGRRAMEAALTHVLGVQIRELVRVDVPDSRDGHGPFYFWQGRTGSFGQGALVTTLPIRLVKHLIEDGLADRLKVPRS